MSHYDKKCAVPGCSNYKSQGRFIDKICSPCYSFLCVRTLDTSSQAYRNHEAIKAQLRFCYMEDLPYNLSLIFKEMRDEKSAMDRRTY
jgi:hypothetical protein